MNSGSSIPSVLPSNTNPAGSSIPNMPGSTTNPEQYSRKAAGAKLRADGTCYRPITPLEALYYHERLDLVTHPLIKGT